MSRKKARKPIVALTVGDYNGIGPEVVIKSVLHPSVRKVCQPVLIGPAAVFEHYSKKLRAPLHLQKADSSAWNVGWLNSVRSGAVPIIESSRVSKSAISPGRITKGAGGTSLAAIRAAVRLAKSGRVDAVVTAPISKEALRKAGSRFPGHTELLQRLTSAHDVAMMLVAPGMKVGLVTIHVPLKKVSGLFTRELLRRRIQVIHDALAVDWRIRSPRLAVLGLNPHAGENGSIGLEEEKCIAPVIRTFGSRGMRIEGPFPADGFFGQKRFVEFDAVIAMYHDQGLIPLKMQAFATGVNVTAGLPIVRTSPDHGTAFDIAGRGKADPSSMIAAIKLAVGIARNRRAR